MITERSNNLKIRIVISGPQGCGKTRAASLLLEFVKYNREFKQLRDQVNFELRISEKQTS